MKVGLESITDTPIQRLVVKDPGDTTHYAGEVIGYRCPLCDAADETLRQIWHEGCRLTGEHGRRYYDDLEPDDPTAPAPELDPRHPINILKAGETELQADLRGEPGIHNGEVIGFECGLCGNADEDVFEIVHDEGCDLVSDERDEPERAEV